MAAGSEVMRRIAAPRVGAMLTAPPRSACSWSRRSIRCCSRATLTSEMPL